TIIVSGARESSVQVAVAGVGSMLPAPSIARTWNVWLPSVSALSVAGELQAANAASSSAHSRVTAPWSSLPSNVSAGAAALSSTGGAAVIAVSGATVSTFQA